ncbi:MAG: hypothetical protein AAFN74_03610 [Myxococcota bacterium]
MTGDDRRPPSDGPSLADELRKSDLWQQVTPPPEVEESPSDDVSDDEPREAGQPEVRVLPADEKWESASYGASAPLISFVSPDSPPGAPETEAEVEAVESELHQIQATVRVTDVEDESFTETVEAWEELDEVLEGDGPFAVPIDVPASPPPPANPAFDLMSDAFLTPADVPPVRSGRPGVHIPSPPRNFGLEQDSGAPSIGLEPHVLKRRSSTRPGSVPPSSGRREQTRSAPPPRPEARRGRRKYPKMLALLKDQSVAARPGRIEPDTPPPVPGTFFPAPREPMEQPEPTDLDRMLLTMAEGLLIGETEDGHTEVRVTLKDEFFAGTELRIISGDGKVKAVLVPPDRDIYWQLSSSIEDLKARLSGRGLDVEDIELLDP